MGRGVNHPFSKSLTYIEDGRADKQKKKEDEVKEKGRKGKNEHEDKEQLTEKDKKRHKTYVAEIIQKLKADKGNNAKTFKEFHASKVKLAKDLEGRYQKKLKRGIYIDIKIKPLERDKGDGDVDFKIKIAPNSQNAEEKVVWQYYKKHLADKKKNWKDIIKSTKNDNAKYKPGVNVEQLETAAWKNGIEVDSGKMTRYKIYDAGKIIGACLGKETSLMRVEMTSGNLIHGHPLDKKRYDKYYKKRIDQE